MYTGKQDIYTLCTLENRIIYSMYTRTQDYILHVHYETGLHTLCTLENKITYSVYTRKQDIYTLCTLEKKIIYSKYTRKQYYIIYVH